MQRITSEFLLYRECARTTWNSFFRLLHDGEFEFQNVEAVLFAAMIASLCAAPEDPIVIDGVSCYHFLRLAPPSGSATVQVSTSRLQKQFRVWREQKLRWDEVELCFSSLFDFGPIDGSFRDFRYVRAVVVATTTSVVRVGDAILIEADQFELIDTSEALRNPE